MEKTIDRYHKSFESSSGKTPEFVAFCRLFKKEFSALIHEVGGYDAEFHNGHFYISGFFKYGEQCWYFSTDDVRAHVMNSLLLRTARDNKDYTGGSNHNVPLIDNDRFKYTFRGLIQNQVREF